MRTLLIAALLLAPLPMAARAQHSISKTEVRTEPPSLTHRRLRDVVWDMFRQDDHRRERSPAHPLETLWLATHPRGTHVPGLCRFDIATFEFAPANRRARGADTATRAIGLAASSHFRFLAPPAGGHRQVADYDLAQGEGDCLAVDPRRHRYFQASSEELAVNGYFALLNFQRALREGASPPLDCSLFPNDTETCGQIILAFSQDEVASVSACDAPGPEENCVRILLAERQLTLFVTSGYGRNPRPFGEAIRARLQSLIVLSHGRPD